MADEIPFSSTNKELARYFENKPGDKVLIDQLAVPLKKIVYNITGNGNETILASKCVLSYSYERLTPNNVNPDSYDTYKLYMEGLWPPLVLRDLQLKRPRSGAKLSLSELVSADSTVIFGPHGDLSKSLVTLQDKTIILYGDMASLATICVLAHEAGHLNLETSEDTIQKADEINEIISSGQPITTKQAAYLMRNETDSWKYAGRLLEPFFDEDWPLSKDSFRAIRHFGIERYICIVRGKILRKPIETRSA